MEFYGIIPSGYVKIAIENGHRKLKMVILHSYVSYVDLPEGTVHYLHCFQVDLSL